MGEVGKMYSRSSQLWAVHAIVLECPNSIARGHFEVPSVAAGGLVRCEELPNRRCLPPG